MEFNFEKTEIIGVYKINYSANEELRGNIWTTFKKGFLSKKSDIPEIEFVHDKFSVSNFNVFRGFHGDHKSYKLVTCVFGSIEQFVLDWRIGSASFGQIYKIEMSRNNLVSILIPPGCGNAYHVKSEQAVYHYKLSYSGEYIDADQQFTVKWYDPKIKNNFGKNFDPITSERDK